MTRATYTFECTETQAELLRRTLALQEELEQLALTAPDGTVFDACETAVVNGGRELQQRLLADAVDRRIAAAEKKGRRSGSVLAARPRRIADPRPGNSSAPSASSR
ncbi:MAG TPA: hypothetical protein VHR66_17300 [Gemmataceae bacterium]|jgi:hypothetical protein|nr:hypothetical protein [Gemmataceae bacterium]